MIGLNIKSRLVVNDKTADAVNLCDKFTEEELTAIGQRVHEGYTLDLNSCTPWRRRIQSAMDLALQVQKDKNFPWTGCSNVVFPLVTIAALQFSSRAYDSIIQGTDVVQYRVAGNDPDGSLTAQAQRIGAHMSWQVLEEDQGWEEQHDRAFIVNSIVGCAFIKDYFNGKQRHNVSELVMPTDLVMNYYAKSVDSCNRKTHVIPLHRNDIHSNSLNGVFRDVREMAWYTQPAQVQIQTPEKDKREGLTPPQSDSYTPFTTLEQHCLFDFDQDGYEEPYVVTIEAASKCVLRIVARWDNEAAVERSYAGEVIRITPTEYFTKMPFIPSPDGGVYDIGFGTLLGPVNESVNSGINQLLDNGTMQNSMGGFLGRGAKIRGGAYTMAPWEWKRVDSTGDDLRKSMVPYPDRQPSMVMFQLLGLLIDYADRVAGTKEQMVGVNPGQNTPAETARTTLEQGMQVYKAIFKRIWRSLKEEFKKKHKLNRTYLPVRQNFGGKGQFVLREDYLTNADQIAPSADPDITSDTQRFNQAQAIRAASMQTPGYDRDEVERNFLRSMRVKGVDKLFIGANDSPPPQDPKVQLELAKLENSKMQWQVELLEERRMNTAKIIALEAQAAKLLTDADAEKEWLKIEAVNAAINSLKAHSDAIDNRLKTISEVMNNDNKDKSNRGSVQGMAGAGNNSAILQSLPSMATGANGAMGGGSFPG